MGQITKSILVSAVTFVALLAVFFGLLAVLAVLNNVTWNDVWDWTGKAALVAGIFWLVSTVVLVLVKSVARSNSDSVNKE